MTVKTFLTRGNHGTIINNVYIVLLGDLYNLILEEEINHYWYLKPGKI